MVRSVLYVVTVQLELLCFMKQQSRDTGGYYYYTSTHIVQAPWDGNLNRSVIIEHPLYQIIGVAGGRMYKLESARLNALNFTENLYPALQYLCRYLQYLALHYLD